MFYRSILVKVEEGTTIEIPSPATFIKGDKEIVYSLTFEDYLANYFADTGYRVKKIICKDHYFIIELYQKLNSEEAFDLLDDIFKPLYTLSKKGFVEWYKEHLSIRLDRLFGRFPKDFDYREYRTHHERSTIIYLLEDLPFLKKAAKELDGFDFMYFETYYRTDHFVIYKTDDEDIRTIIKLDFNLLQERDILEDYFPVIEDYLRESLKGNDISLSMPESGIAIIRSNIEAKGIKESIVRSLNEFLSADRNEMIDSASTYLEKAMIAGYLDKAKEVVRILLDETEHPIYMA